MAKPNDIVLAIIEIPTEWQISMKMFVQKLMVFYI